MLRFENAKKKDECILRLETPYKSLKTDSYVVFAKGMGRSHIEINNLDLDEIKNFIEKLNQLIKENEAKFLEED